MFEVDLIKNKLKRHKIIINNKTLFIKNRKTINIRLSHNNIRLYNTLFISYLNINLIFLSRII